MIVHRYPTVSILSDVSPKYELNTIRRNEIDSKLEIGLLKIQYSHSETTMILPFLKRVNNDIGRYCRVLVPVKIIIVKKREGMSHPLIFENLT